MTRWILLTWLILTPFVVSASDLAAILADADPLVTLPVRKLASTLKRAKPLRDQATPEQQAQISLLELRYLAIKGDYAAATEIIAELDRATLNPDYRIRTYNLAGQISAGHGDYVTAFTYLSKALDLLSWTERSTLKYIVLSGAAETYAYAGDTKKARHYADRSLHWAEKTGDPRNMCTTWAHMGYIAEQEGNYQSARQAYQRELDLCKEVGDELFQGHARNGLGKVSLEMGEYQQALSWFEAAMADMHIIGFADGLSSSRLGIAETLYALDDKVKALQYLELAINDMVATGKLAGLEDAYLLRSKIAESNGNLTAALDYLRQYSETKEKVINEKRIIRLAGLQVEFDTSYKEQQIGLLEQKNQLLEVKERADKQQLWFYLLGLLAVTLISVLLLLLLRKTHKERIHFKALSRLDGLTGLYNHVTSYELAESAFADSRQGHKQFTIIVADIDLFKQTNDTYGHAAGDEVLRYLAGLFRGIFGEQSIVGRTGGEEFTIFLPGTNAEDARELIEKCRQQLSPVVDYGSAIKVTLSFGYSQADEGQILMTSVVREADEALYHAKNTGRDKVVEYRELLSVESDEPEDLVMLD